MKWPLSKLQIFSLLMLVGLVLSACGQAAAPTATESGPTATVIPTFAFVQPTPPPQLVATQAGDATEAVVSEEPTLDPTLVERGVGRYEALECGSCHGENGEGTDLGPELVSLTLSEDDFIDLLRSGGPLGSEHQYSTDRLSNNSVRNLYAYILSLAVDEEG